MCFTGTLAFDLKGLGKGQKVLLAKAEMNKKYLNTVTNKEVFVVNYKLFFSAHQSKIPSIIMKNLKRVQFSSLQNINFEHLMEIYSCAKLLKRLELTGCFIYNREKMK